MRIAIVNDSETAVESLKRTVLISGGHEVAWIARDGVEAVKNCYADRPDLVLMDLLMPNMNGAEATRLIMQSVPCPVLVVTGSVTGNASLVFEAMGYGALDAVRTPVFGQLDKEGASALLKKISMLQRLTQPVQSWGRRTQASSPHAGIPNSGKLLAIGSSTGGPRALASILSKLPRNYPAGIVIVQHVDVQFSGELAHWLNEQTPLAVRVAVKGDKPAPGTALIAGTNDHLILNKSGELAYSPIPREFVYRPSVDVFFESVAECWVGDVTAVLLTGMGRDGGLGMLRLHEKGAYTIAEHESTCAVYGMPKAAVELNAAMRVLPLHEIAGELVRKYSPVDVKETVKKEL